MRFRPWLALVVVAVILAGAIPCEALMQRGSGHTCCDQGCPAAVEAATHHDAPLPADCCAVSNQRDRQTRQQIQASSVILAPNDEPGALVAVLLDHRQFHRSDHPVPVARTAPLHVLFSVYLI